MQAKMAKEKELRQNGRQSEESLLIVVPIFNSIYKCQYVEWNERFTKLRVISFVYVHNHLMPNNNIDSHNITVSPKIDTKHTQNTHTAREGDTTESVKATSTEALHLKLKRDFIDSKRVRNCANINIYTCINSFY